MGRRLAGVLGSALACLGGCSLVTDLGGYAGGSSSTAGGDAATTVQDGGADAQATDASAPVDANVPFCKSLSPSPLLCADFDSQPFSLGWTAVVNNTPGQTGPDSTDFRSAPSSLLVTLPTTTSSRENGVKRSFGTFSDLSYAFDMKIVAMDPGGKLDLITFVFPNNRGIYLHVNATSAVLSEQIPAGGSYNYPGHPLAQAFPIGSWTRVRIDVHLAPVPPTATVWMDSVKVLDADPLDPAQVPEPVTIGLGLQWVTSTSSPWTMRFDNAVFDAK